MADLADRRSGRALILLVMTAQTGLYNLYLGRPGRAVAMSGALAIALCLFVFAPGTPTAVLAFGVFLALSALVFADLRQLDHLVAETPAAVSAQQKGAS
ncbi:hypothetical protein [Jannaschia sp. M317]|uniref:hypothetical protein n=1 Tax=Jannaschia sp. M317 TaxID=2867011 RepID=UPI0021A7CE01|nr:hypothetical protein [Jannaschia sp. M317]UWQ17804.1 hypothetical protein K3551_00345 [Jannaschia sp. M317]